MVSETGLVTAEELLALPRGLVRRELVRGELRELPLIKARCSLVAMSVASSLLKYAEGRNLGRVFGASAGFLLAVKPDTVRTVSVSFIRRELLESAPCLGSGYWPGPPDLAVEVVSPDDLYLDVEEKVDQFLIAGAGVVAVVNPVNRTVFVRGDGVRPVILGGSDTLDGGDVVPGWRMPVAEIFAQ